MIKGKPGRLFSVVAVAMLLAGCATEPSIDAGDGIQILPASPPAAIAADGEVLAQATVRQADGEPPSLCLGAVAESYPPQCGSPEIVGWDWATVDGEETASGVTWGSYAIQGTWDGQHLTVTQPPVILALYDPMPIVDSREDPANAGVTGEARLQEVQADVHSSGIVDVLTSSLMNGYVFVEVIYDDGQIQTYFDELYGPDVVAVRSALDPIAP